MHGFAVHTGHSMSNGMADGIRAGNTLLQVAFNIYVSSSSTHGQASWREISFETLKMVGGIIFGQGFALFKTAPECVSLVAGTLVLPHLDKEALAHC